jgi:hypothetical protein
MTFRMTQKFACFMAGIAVFCLISSAHAQSGSPDMAGYSSSQPVESARVAGAGSVSTLPDAPQPQNSGSSSSQTASQTPGPDATAKQAGPGQQGAAQQGDEEYKKEQKQRVLGIVPNFNTSYEYGAPPLTTKQKYTLAFKSQVDPAAFGIAGFVALISQAEGSHYGYGGGIGGYGKRYGQTYADSFDGQMIGNAILPALLHQDPRYFRLGRGPVKRRILYALGTNVIAHHDGSGRWEPNYSNVLGNFASGGISNLYLPANERGFGSTITGGLLVLAEGGVGSMFQEFWPDISRHFLHKDPTDGQDAINKLKPDPSAGPLFHNPPKHPKPAPDAPAQDAPAPQ